MPTRKNQHKGGRFTKKNNSRIQDSIFRTASKKKQIVHCVSQLRRFAKCFMEGDQSRILQFGYNLGRLQELCEETTRPDIWWKPIETLIEKKQWAKLYKHIDIIRNTVVVEYDGAVLEKGC
jgi:hypothetical protein